VGIAVDRRVLVGLVPLHEALDPLHVELEEGGRPRHDGGSAVPSRRCAAPPCEPRHLQGCGDRRGAGDRPHPRRREGQAQPDRPQVGARPRGDQTPPERHRHLVAGGGAARSGPGRLAGRPGPRAPGARVTFTTPSASWTRAARCRISCSGVRLGRAMGDLLPGEVSWSYHHGPEVSPMSLYYRSPALDHPPSTDLTFAEGGNRLQRRGRISVNHRNLRNNEC
jgi:hypothetical protein